MNQQLRRLYDVSNKYRALFDRMASELTEVWDEHSLQAIEALSDGTEEEAINLAAEIKNLEAQAEMVKQAKKEMEKRQTSLENFAEYLKGHLIKILVSSDIKAITTCPMFAIRIRKNRLGVDVVNEDLIPEQYYKQKITFQLDKISIHKDIENGIEVPGAILSSKLTVAIK